MKLKRLCYLFIVLLLLSVSCKKDDVASTTNPNVIPNDTIGNGNNNGGGNTGYDSFYFRCFITQILQDWRAGNTTVYFETNSEWSVTLDKSHFEASASVSPDTGYGSGSIVITYGEHSNHYDCSDYLYIKFRYVDRIYPNGDKHYDVKTYTIYRRYHKIEP